MTADPTPATVHINTGGPKTWIRRVGTCPCCKDRRRIVGFFQEWYGTTWTCCGCGDSWADGEILPRPFCRGWRGQAIAKAKVRWREASPTPVAMREIRERMEAYADDC